MKLTMHRTIYILTYIYIFFSVFEFYINATIGHISRYFMLLYTLVLVISFIFYGGIRRVKNLQLLYICWMIYALMTVSWSSNIYIFRVYAFTFITMTIVLVCMLSFSFKTEEMKRIIFFYQICSLILCVLGVFFSKPLLDDYTNNIRYVLYIGGQRADPNYLLALYVISFQIGLYKFLNETKLKAFNAISVLISAYVILYTGSRSGIVIIFVSVLIIAWERIKRVSFIQIIGIIIGAGVLFFVAYIIAYRFIPEATLNRVFGIGSLSFSDSTGRLDSWTVRFGMWNNPLYWIFGMGFGSNTAHSTLLSFVLEFGILGFLLYFIPTFSIAKRCISDKNSLAIALFCGGMIQAFLCPATNMRFFWNAMIIPVLILNSYNSNKTVKKHEVLR